MILDQIADKTKERVAALKKVRSKTELIASVKGMNLESDFPFEKALSKEGISFICEVKKASPSKGVIAEDFPFADIAVSYEKAGADAIYIGAPAYGARQAAGNSLEDLTEVIHYAHTYGVQVLVTLNTLLHDDEYADAVTLAHALYHIGVDALIIQDTYILKASLELSI